MTEEFRNLFQTSKPVIAMVHPGALQQAGFGAVMFGNEDDRSCEFQVDPASTATMAHIVGRLRQRPFYGCFAFRKGVLPPDSE